MARHAKKNALDWDQQVELLKQRAAEVPPGKEKSELLRRAHELEVAKDIRRWAGSSSRQLA